MASVVVPGAPPDLRERLFHEFRVEVPVFPFGGQTLVRVSCQRHVRPGDVPALVAALRKLVPRRTAPVLAFAP